MPVTSTNALYDYHSRQWKLTRDCVKGNPAIKDGGATYLPAEFRVAEPDRYQTYLDRAYFVGFTGRTLANLIGMAFRKAPTVELPSSFDPLIENIDGTGQSLQQLAKSALVERLQTSRYMLLVDYPAAPNELDAETEARLGLRPTIAGYPAESLINWRFDTVNGQRKLALAVLLESVDTSTDEFTQKPVPVYRVLRLRDGVYTQQMYSDNGQPSTEERPVLARRAPLDHIPLHGVRELITPTLYPMAIINLAHYRNIADLEEAGSLVAQPMLHINIGETDPTEWKTLNAGDIKLGSRNGIITKNGSAEIFQAQSDNLNVTLKTEKESEIVMIGASIVQRGGQAETAEAVRINAGAETATLDTLVDDLSEDIEAALEDMALFVGADPGAIIYRMNKSFFDVSIDAQMLNGVLALGAARLASKADMIGMVQAGKIGYAEGRTAEDIEADVANELVGDSNII